MGQNYGKYNGFLATNNGWQPYHLGGCVLDMDIVTSQFFNKDSSKVYGIIDKSYGLDGFSIDPENPYPISPVFDVNVTSESGYTILGDPGWWKVTNSAVSGRHQFNKLNTFDTRNMYRISIKYYVPLDSSVQVLGLGIGNNQGHTDIYNFEKGKIKTASVITNRLSSQFVDDLVVATGLSDGSQIYTGDLGEVWYVKDYKSEVYDGIACIQTVDANRPAYTGDNLEIVQFDGVSEWLDFCFYDNYAAALQDVSDGTVVWVGKSNNNDASLNVAFCVSNSAGVGADASTTHYINLDSTNQTFQIYNDGSTSGTIDCSVNNNHVYIYTRTNAWIDGNKYSYDDIGFIGNIQNLDVFELGRWSRDNSVGNYFQGNMMAIAMYNRPISDKQAKFLTNYYKTKFEF